MGHPLKHVNPILMPTLHHKKNLQTLQLKFFPPNLTLKIRKLFVSDAFKKKEYLIFLHVIFLMGDPQLNGPQLPTNSLPLLPELNWLMDLRNTMENPLKF